MMSNRVFNSQTANGILPLNPLLIAMGYWFGIEVVDKFGKNADINTSFEDVWTEGGTWVPLTAEEIMQVVSSDANDGIAGTGGRTASLVGLDGNFNEIEETVTLTGTTPVDTTKKFIRVFRCSVKSVGSNGTNVGDITITAKVSATVQAKILADEGQSQQAIFTIKAGHIGFLGTSFASFNSKGIKIATLQLLTRLRNAADDGHEAWEVKHELTLADGHIDFNMLGSEILPAKSDIRIRAKATAANQSIIAGFKLITRDVDKV